METETIRKIINKNTDYEGTREEMKKLIKSSKVFIPCFLVFTQEKNRDFYRGLTQKVFCQASKEGIDEIIKKQTAASKGFQISNDIIILASIYRKAIENKKFKRSEEIDTMNAALVDVIAEINGDASLADQEKKERMEYTERVTGKKLWQLYKNYLETHGKQLKVLDLTDEEKLAVQFQNIDPFLMIIFDEYYDFAPFQELFAMHDVVNVTNLFYKCKNLPASVFESCVKLGKV